MKAIGRQIYTEHEVEKAERSDVVPSRDDEPSKNK
jgi:hypothetical protein